MDPARAASVDQMTIAALVPFLPLLLFRYPLAELAQKLFTRLLGL